MPLILHNILPTPQPYICQHKMPQPSQSIWRERRDSTESQHRGHQEGDATLLPQLSDLPRRNWQGDPLSLEGSTREMATALNLLAATG